MKILLDTSAYSAFKRGQEEIVSVVQEAEEIYLTPVTLGELKAGFRRGKKAKQNETELRDFLASPRVLVVNMTEETAERYASIQISLWSAGTPIPTNDLWIAASGMEHGLRILTTDEHFKNIPQVLVDFIEAR
ncbi:MAG: type II toxin-antitoxin system VapC family toxin [Planctomycetes bacterium]|nr:type II toxin-antitoxin system VapC family toxin [Planctomycetota bacterium]